MDSTCIKQTVCKVLKIFQYGKYLVAYVLNNGEKVYSMFDVNPFVCPSISTIAYCLPCADPESFARGDPTYFFVFDKGKRIQIALKAGHHRRDSETPFKSTTSERLKASHFFICQYFSFCVQDKFLAELS